MTWIAVGVGVAGLAYSVYSSEHAKSQANKAQKAEQDAINNGPKYQVQDEAYQNRNIAEGQAFGRNRAIQMQQQNIGQEASNAGAAARDVSSSTSDLLSTIAAINANKNTNLRGLAQDEAQVQQQNLGSLYNANNNLIDEKDKAWNYNSNMPYQMKIAMLRDKIQYNQNVQQKATDNAFASATSIAGAYANK